MGVVAFQGPRLRPFHGVAEILALEGIAVLDLERGDKGLIVPGDADPVSLHIGQHRAAVHRQLVQKDRDRFQPRNRDVPADLHQPVRTAHVQVIGTRGVLVQHFDVVRAEPVRSAPGNEAVPFAQIGEQPAAGADPKLPVPGVFQSRHAVEKAGLHRFIRIRTAVVPSKAAVRPHPHGPITIIGDGCHFLLLPHTEKQSDPVLLQIGDQDLIVPIEEGLPPIGTGHPDTADGQAVIHLEQREAPGAQVVEPGRITEEIQFVTSHARHTGKVPPETFLPIHFLIDKRKRFPRTGHSVHQAKPSI